MLDINRNILPVHHCYPLSLDDLERSGREIFLLVDLVRSILEHNHHIRSAGLLDLNQLTSCVRLHDLPLLLVQQTTSNKQNTVGQFWQAACLYSCPWCPDACTPSRFLEPDCRLCSISLLWRNRVCQLIFAARGTAFWRLGQGGWSRLFSLPAGGWCGSGWIGICWKGLSCWNPSHSKSLGRICRLWLW